MENNQNYVLGSHNSWSYLSPKKWWMKLLRFTARCQKLNIVDQYKAGVRCFDLRVRFDDDFGTMYIVHGPVVYKCTNLYLYLKWLNDCRDVYVRVILDVRTNKANTAFQRICFRNFCNDIEKDYPYITFFCGQNLIKPVPETLYDFGNHPTMDEFYASVRPPRLLDDWFPWIYAKLHNRRIREQGTDKDILLIDFVDIK